MQSWFLRNKELIDVYEPELLYWDGAVPFEEVGRRIVAHLYNQSMKRNDGRQEAVLCYKPIRGTHGDFREGMGIMDLERGTFLKAQKTAWQNDTSIGPWFWDGKLETYRPMNEIIDMFVDLVSKNGVLLLNVPLQPDGTLDEPSRRMLADLTAWTTINGEAIFDTRPWEVYGEGPSIAQAERAAHIKKTTKVVEGVVFLTEDPHVRDSNLDPLGPQDIRFTASKDGKNLYAFAMEWPADGRLLIRSLSTGNHALGKINGITLLGHGQVEWSRNADGLELILPEEAPSRYACAFRIEL